MIRLDVDPRGVAKIWLARAEKHNAMGAEMIAALTQAARNLSTDDGVRVVVLAAEGKTFCAGGDLDWMRQQFEASPEERRKEASALAAMLGAFDALPKPVIARVQGNAFGGGLGLMSVSDAVVAADSARFALTETRLGLIPATIGPYVVARIGASAARRYFFSGRRFGAVEALDMGLISRSVSEDELDAAIEDEVSPYFSTAPGAVADAKRLCRRLSRSVTGEEVEASIDALVERWNSDEAKAGISAFFEGRKAPWNKS